MSNETWKETLPKGIDQYSDLITKEWKRTTVDTANATPETVNNYILQRIASYVARQYVDTSLWEVFREDFEEWTIDIWKLGDKEIVRDLRNQLRRYGVNVKKGKDSGKIIERLQDVIEDPEEPEWSQEDVEYQLRTGNATSLYDEIESELISKKHGPYAEGARAMRPRPQTGPRTTPRTIPQVAQQQHQDEDLYEQEQNTYEDPPAHPNTQRTRPIVVDTGEDTYRTPDDSIPIKEITNLMNIYLNDEAKYGGEMYDILDAKLRIFYDYCTKAGIKACHYHYVFSAMLKGRASTFYYDKIQGNKHDFGTMVRLTKTHFENDETRQLYLSEWREITFQRVINNNPTKTRSECLQLLFDKLQQLQRALPDQQRDSALRDQVLSACRGVPECNLALFQPGNTYEAVCAQLRSAVATAMRNQEYQQHVTYGMPRRG